MTCGWCDKESLNEHCCFGEALSRRSALLLGLNLVCPSFWQMFPVVIEVLQLKIPGTQRCLVRIWHFLNTFIPGRTDSAISRAGKGKQMPGTCKAGRSGTWLTGSNRALMTGDSDQKRLPAGRGSASCVT